jgi:predicted nucleic acid-binding protein
MAGRTPLGSAAKKKIISVRVTEEEAAVLKARYGSPTRALRAFIQSLMPKEN